MLFRKKKNKSINQINMMAIIFAGIFAFVSACIIVLNEYVDFKKESALLEEQYIETLKKSASLQLQILFNIVDYRYQNSFEVPLEELHQLIMKDVRYLTANIQEQHTLFIQKSSGELLYRSKEDPFITEKNDILLTKEYAPLMLILGSSVGMENMKTVLEQKKEEYEDKIIGFIFKIYMLTLFLYLVSTIEYRYVSDIMGREIRFIVESFKEASKSYRTIDMEKLNFTEFRDIAAHANFMLGKIKEKNSALLELNSTLEHLVEEKTQELQCSVDFTQELLQKQDHFVKNAIHEINTPLSIILMNIDLYNLKYEKNPYLLKIEAAVKVLDNIYEDLAYVVKKDRVVYEKTMVNFSHFIHDRVAYFEDVAEGNKLSITCDIEEDMFVLFNEIELQRICDNNLSNAIKYSFENKPLHVRLYEVGEDIFLEVKNQGEKILNPDKLFDRYYRENKARGGFGLGLNIVKEICEAQDIAITILSDDEHTIFRYRFPKG